MKSADFAATQLTGSSLSDFQNVHRWLNYRWRLARASFVEKPTTLRAGETVMFKLKYLKK